MYHNTPLPKDRSIIVALKWHDGSTPNYLMCRWNEEMEGYQTTPFTSFNPKYYISDAEIWWTDIPRLNKEQHN